MEEELYPEGTTIDDLRISSLIDLRELITDPVRASLNSRTTEALVETIDMALDKLINETIIKKSKTNG